MDQSEYWGPDGTSQAPEGDWPLRDTQQPTHRSKSRGRSRNRRQYKPASSSENPPPIDQTNNPRGRSSGRPVSTNAISKHPSVRSRRSVSSARSVASSVFMGEIKHDVMVNYLYQQQCTNMWVSEGAAGSEGCVIRKERGAYIGCPPTLIETPFAHSMRTLNVQCAMTVNSRLIKTFLESSPEAIDVPLKNGLYVQMMPTMEDLAKCKKAQCAAIIAAEGLLVVWDDDALHLIQRAKQIESELMELVWTSEGEEDKPVGTHHNKERRPRVEAIDFDPETGRMRVPDRPVHLMNSVLVSLTLFVIMLSLGAAMRQLAKQVHIDGFWPRIALIGLGPIQVFFTLFFVQVLCGSLAQMVGPIRQLDNNSRYYSGRPPPQLQYAQLPHVTIQCPVFKEGLQAVIAPTVRSLKEAMTTYELQGGSCNLFVNDDGLQLLDEEERLARIEFYTDNNIGWTARPAHGDGGFQRRGKFKKASNMNFALMISCKVEETLAGIARPAGWSDADESKAYYEALEDVIAETGGIAWADGNVRIGDYILIVDSDTRVPKDCLLDAVSEMDQSPEVAIMQFSSGVMQVVHNYFENGITFFTNLIYSAIRYTVANGDVAPFVGHNAVLRWTALQSISFTDEDGYEKFWSESHVSEDFDMSLRLQCAGYIIRLAAWAGDGFREGVSLTVYDELARWEKYAYGCNELLFHPVRQWPTRGPFTRLFRQFLRSVIPLTSKITVIGYVGTYYAISAAWVLTVVNYFLKGWYGTQLDQYYVDSWQVWFTIIIVFSGLGNIGLAVMRYRAGEKKLLSALVENFKWTVLMAVFLGGLSLHVSGAVLAHMFEVDMSWDATAKELENSNFFNEIPKIIKKFKWSMLFSIIAIAVMITLATSPLIPVSWHITDFVAILPMSTVAVSHLLLPLVLNPALMTFSF